MIIRYSLFMYALHTYVEDTKYLDHQTVLVIRSSQPHCCGTKYVRMILHIS